jgi:hypothetical protein
MDQLTTRTNVLIIDTLPDVQDGGWMSGYTRLLVRVSEIELRKLHEAGGRLAALDRNLDETFLAAQDERRKALQEQLVRLGERRSTFQMALQDLSARTPMLSSASLLEQVEDDFTGIEIESEEGLLHRETPFRLAKLEQRQAQRAADERLRQAKEQRDLFEAACLLEDSPQERRGLAAAWLAAAQAVFEHLRQAWAGEGDNRGWWDECSARLEQAVDNLEKGVPEGTLLEAQQLVGEMRQEYNELEQRALRRTLLFHSASGWAAWLLALVKHNQVCRALDFNGLPLEGELEVDFWTGGRLGLLHGQLERAALSIEQNRKTIHVEDLQQVLERLLPLVEPALAELVWESRMKMLDAQLRCGLGELASEALEALGYALELSGFTGEDLRAGYSLSLLSAERLRLIVDIQPGDDHGACEVHLSSRDPLAGSRVAVSQAVKAAAKAFRSSGLQVISQDRIPDAATLHKQAARGGRRPDYSVPGAGPG